MAFDIVLCYDTDVFELSEKPPVEWSKVKKMLIDDGAASVHLIGAKRSIEDWFLIDTIGVLKYLKLPTDSSLTGINGTKKLQNIFKKANKLYIKGGDSGELIDSLNIEKIMGTICSQIKPICKALGVKCDGTRCNKV